ncbi:probable LRR receptor-like serine/threonine-protein kinase At1g56140 [Ziziphus jujuba]|uniref:non-specific serine/threonine protein kinase n=1 Tax=Ziziphus jujuba TaxID=326968 RepID=A0ABM4A109_ZIZJJ|nr:probable LRR receptor-like serine/threonine-protein kinase At1g56140 [Ziziphus jujuba]
MRQRKQRFMAESSLAFVFTYFAFCIFGFVFLAESQNQTQPTTDPSEVKALNSLFEHWKIKADTQKWNISGEPCSGAAIDQTSISSADYNSFIKCNCSYNNGSLCHIVQLKVTEIDIIGPIPEDLWTLIHLSYLDVSKNYLTGNLSRSIGNLTRLQYLNVAVNALKGELPKELGNLTELLSLSIADNYFSGHLPPELGNLSNLQKLYIQSSGVNGEIPSTFANLQSLDTLWASDSELAGKIPDFIGNWSKLKILRLQGNSFEGSIPMAFGNLTSLSELRVSDLTNGSSSLEFIKSLKNLSVLELRNNNISDSFPSNIGEYQKLKELDLSFNNISGEIPNSLFNLSSISMLFLGNNKMSGALPQEKIASLRVVDLSYNNLGGEVPSWVNQQKLQLNLVGNNFTATSLNSSGLPSGLECLQQNFPCDRGRGTHYSFAINCGGEQFTSADRIVYERDNNTLGPATYYVSDTNRWAVSIVGFFTGINNARYTVDSSYQFTNTLDSELFQTSRLSASSLRYYGLRLENGEYTVNLQFAETVFEDSTNWKNLGRRVFDVYIQGIRVLQNFDIRKESGWVTSQAIRMEFKAQVSENYLEIHLFWAGKGTTSIPTEGTYGPSIAAISITPDFEPTVNNIPRTSKKKKTGLITGIVVGGGLLSFLSIFIIFYLVQKENDSQTNDDIELLGMDVRPFTFSYDQLKMATNDFSSANVLGEGGYGSVYKGKLQDGRVIAAKQLSLTSHQGKDQFVAEIATMTAVQHRNLVQLYGCCHEGNNLILVYEYMANNSLEHVLFGSKNLALKWSTRFNICLGIARGLAYLHEESQLRIIHRDVKASNVLLDSNLIPKISDFGLAKLFDTQKTHISTQVSGTAGYLAPEYAMRGQLTEKTDIFAFGVLALEIVSGRPNSDMNLDEEKTFLLGWVWKLYKEGRELEVVDSAITLSESNEEQIRRVIRIALLCTQTSPSLRPTMSRVVAMLLGDVQVTNEITTPGFLSDRKFNRLISSISDISLKGNFTSFYNSSAGTSMVSTAGQSVINANQYPMFQDSIREGR